MRPAVILVAASLVLAACADPVPMQPMAAPLPLPSGVAQQNQFVPPPGGFAGSSAAIRSGQMQGQAGQVPPAGGAAGFVPLDTAGAFPTAPPAGSPAASGPNLVAYALSTTHPVGTSRYRRANPLRWQTWERNCMQFHSQNAAQEAFLAAGGPERDRQNLDPDGDGYACWWNPEPFRRAIRAAG
jgi:hypothetical protein